LVTHRSGSPSANECAAAARVLPKEAAKWQVLPVQISIDGDERALVGHRRVKLLYPNPKD
jgi:hypothetical protein